MLERIDVEIRRHLRSRQKRKRLSVETSNLEESCVSIFERSTDVVIFRFRARRRRVRESFQGEERGGQILHRYGSERRTCTPRKEETILITASSFEGNCSFLRERSSVSNAFVDRFRRTLLLFADETQPSAMSKRDGRSPRRLILYQ